ncbi:MAG: helix-turn-helix domain-containing protein [Lachnospiraceae bacterium]|nr:helix-turn-helix domain-containing protein [Lachnospiraceae bacterium]
MTIKELRMKTGLSQSQFAKKYKFTTKQVQSWEQGWRNTPEYVLYLLERVIDLDYANTVLQMNEIQTDEKSEGIK